jgi:hypothetical protein
VHPLWAQYHVGFSCHIDRYIRGSWRYWQIHSSCVLIKPKTLHDNQRSRNPIRITISWQGLGIPTFIELLWGPENYHLPHHIKILDKFPLYPLQIRSWDARIASRAH